MSKCRFVITEEDEQRCVTHNDLSVYCAQRILQVANVALLSELSAVKAERDRMREALKEISERSNAMNPWEYACDHGFERKGDPCGDCHGCRRAALMLAIVKYREALTPPQSEKPCRHGVDSQTVKAFGCFDGHASKPCEARSPEIKGGVYSCLKLVGHEGRHYGESGDPRDFGDHGNDWTIGDGLTLWPQAAKGAE